MSGNHITYYPTLTENLESFNSKEEYLAFLCKAIDTKSVWINAFANGDVTEPAIHFAIVFPGTKDCTVRLTLKQIEQNDHRGHGVLFSITKNEYTHLKDLIKQVYDDCRVKMQSFDPVFKAPQLQPF